MRARWPDGAKRRRALAAGLAAGGPIDPLGDYPNIQRWLNNSAETDAAALRIISLYSVDPDDLTLRDARALAQADRLYHPADAPPAILDRARADADRIMGTAPAALPPGLSVQLEMPR